MEFPQASVTEYFLIIVSVQPTIVAAESDTNAIVGVEQLSVAETIAIFGFGNATLQPENVKFRSGSAVGSVVSIVLIKF